MWIRGTTLSHTKKHNLILNVAGRGQSCREERYSPAEKDFKTMEESLLGMFRPEDDIFPSQAMEVFILHSFNKYLLKACSVPDIVLSTRDTVMNSNKIPAIITLAF